MAASAPLPASPGSGAPAVVPIGLSEESLAVRDWVHDFAARVIRPAAAEWDEREETPWPILQEAAKVGLYGIDMLQTMHADQTGLLMAAVNEELFWGDAGIGLAIFGSHLASAGIFATGTPEQIVQWIPRCYGSPGDIHLGAYAITEPDSGSDVGSLRTRARRDGDDWVIDGNKCFITNGGIADVHVIVATVDPSLGHAGHASFVIDKGTPGLSMGAKHHKLGLRASHTAEVVLEGVRVPSENRRSEPAPGPSRSAAARRRCAPWSSPGRSSAPRRSGSRGLRTSTLSTMP